MSWRPIVAKWRDGSRWHLAWRWALVQATLCQFSFHFCCGQMAGWIKMPLCIAVGLGPDDFMLDGDPAYTFLENWGRAPSNFRPISIVVKRLQYRCMHQDATWYGGRTRPWRLYVRWGPRSPPQKDHP